MSDNAMVWPCLTYTDAHAAIAFLEEAFGFKTTAVHGAGPTVEHAELRWPPGGGIMLGSPRPDNVQDIPAGQGLVYLVTDQPDALFARAVAAGATVLRELRDEDYGSRGFSVRDPQGVIWSFGTYSGE
ncbi:VOC family protein [Catellatospora citrea]|uniref:Glyoxalase n=1 Tax=Catellatospora citrea TaxID=53366 RepID=A0A8J3KB92_9ACTN|nr:VOC family protein [Catellatospora citrea]RKE10957.1 putative glyoxalase superfamily protein PhnB [Catellatospora citrea]GIF96412.1 glyoxalase [Catellatospora citrea]